MEATKPVKKQRLNLSRLVGVLLVSAAILGWVLSLAGMVTVWALKPAATRATQQAAQVFGSTLQATDDLLKAMDDSLGQISASMATLEGSMGEISATIGSMTAITETTSSLLQTEIPNTLNTTTASLESLETTALLIDRTLAFISAIPFIGGSQYKPEIPLNEGVKEIKASLQDLPESFADINTQLLQASASLEVIQTSVETLSGQMEHMQTNLALAQDVVQRYRKIIANLQPTAKHMQTNAALYLTLLAGLFSIFQVWLGLVQLGLYTQGMERLAPKRVQSAV